MNTWQVASGGGHNERETHLIGPAGDRDQIKNCLTNYKISSFWWGNGCYLRWYDHVNENACFAPLYFNQHSVCESFSICCSLAVVNTFSLLALCWQGACYLTKDFKIPQEWKITQRVWCFEMVYGLTTGKWANKGRGSNVQQYIVSQGTIFCVYSCSNSSTSDFWFFLFVCFLKAVGVLFFLPWSKNLSIGDVVS